MADPDPPSSGPAYIKCCGALRNGLSKDPLWSSCDWTNIFARGSPKGAGGKLDGEFVTGRPEGA